jgi:hypothetical protein
MNKLVELQIRPLHWVLWPTTYKHEWSSCAPTDTYYEFLCFRIYVREQ